MSASEKMRRVTDDITLDVDSHLTQARALRGMLDLRKAVPQLLAVVEAMEKLVEDGTAPITDEIVYVIRSSTRDQIKAALAALDEALP